MRRIGRVNEVGEELRGADLIVDAALGATTLSLEHVGYFDDLGGQARLRNVETDVTEGVTYLRLDDDAATLTLGAGTLAAWPAATTRVDVLPLENVRVAAVLLDDADNEQDIVDAHVPLALYDRLPLGVRDDEADRESVVIATEGLWLHEIADIVGQEPDMTGEFTDPTTLPPPAASDGLPPAASPAPVLIGGIGVLHVRWAAIANVDPVTYDVHLSLTPGFTPTPATKVLETTATAATIKADPAGAPLVYSTTYYVRIVARDLDGSAAAGAEASGSAVQITSPDIAVGSIVSDLIASNTITADKLSAVLILAGAIKTAETGQRVEVDAGGVRLIAQDGTTLVDLPTQAGEEATFNGQILAAALEVLGNATYRGVGTLTPGASFVLSLSVPNPTTSPTLNQLHDTVAFTNGVRTRVGLSWDATASTYWTTEEYVSGGVERVRAVEYNASGVQQRSVDLITATGSSGYYLEGGGAVRVGTRVYVVGRYYTDVGLVVSQWRIIALDQATLASLGSGIIGSGNNARPSIASDGTNIITAQTNGSGVIQFQKWTLANNPATSGGLITSTGKTFGDNNVECMGFAVAESGWWVAALDHSSTGGIDSGAHKYSTAGAYVANTFFESYGAGDIWGLAHDGTRFWSVDTAFNRLVKHTNWDWTTASPLYWVGYSWYNNGSAAETLVSPRASIQMRRRSKMVVTTPAFPAGVDRARLYMNIGATEPSGGAPSRFSGFLQVTDALTVRSFETFDAVGTPPENPASNTFGAATPAELRSSGGEALLRANGYPRCRLRITTTRNPGNNIDNYLRFGTEDVDTDGFYAPVGDAASATPDSTYDIVLPFAGNYIAFFRATFAASGTGERELFWDLAGVVERASFRPTAAGAFRAQTTFEIDAPAAGTILRVGVNQSSGAALNVTVSRLLVVYLGPA